MSAGSLSGREALSEAELDRLSDFLDDLTNPDAMDLETLDGFFRALIAGPIAIVAGEVDPDWPVEPLTDEKRDEMVAWMAAGMARSHKFFARHRRAAAWYESQEHTYRREAPKVGRNERCPCASGKKFKHCCGASQSV